MRPNLSTADFLSFLFPWRNAHVVEQVAGEVARECRGGIWQQVYRRTTEMSPAELRGYVRAQAAGAVCTEVEQAIHRRHLRIDLRSRLIAASVDQLVTLVAHDALSGEPPTRTRTAAA